jgi:hypothetical protein
MAWAQIIATETATGSNGQTYRVEVRAPARYQLSSKVVRDLQQPVPGRTKHHRAAYVYRGEELQYIVQSETDDDALVERMHQRVLDETRRRLSEDDWTRPGQYVVTPSD